MIGAMDMDRVPDLGRLGGLVTVRELRAAGFGESDIRTAVRRGALVAVVRGVYARAGRASKLKETPEGQRALRLAGVLAGAGPPVVGSHQDAAIVHGLALLERPSDDVITVTRPPSVAGRRTGRPGIRLHIAALPPSQVTVTRRIPVTSAARTVLDLARSSSFRSGVVVADSALQRRKTSKGELLEVLASCTSWPGIEVARQVVEFSDWRAESPFESISRVAFRDGGLPAPELQVQVGSEVRMIGRADFLWRQHRTIGEADGALKYENPDRARLQLRRDADLRAAGFEVVHFTWREIVATPDAVVNSIREAFRRAEVLQAAERRRA